MLIENETIPFLSHKSFRYLIAKTNPINEGETHGSNS